MFSIFLKPVSLFPCYLVKIYSYHCYFHWVFICLWLTLLYTCTLLRIIRFFYYFWETTVIHPESSRNFFVLKCFFSIPQLCCN